MAHQLLGAQGEAARALQLAGAADEVHVVGGEADRLACRSGSQPARGQAQQRIDGQQSKAQFAAGTFNGTVAAYQGEPVTPGLGQGSQPADLAFPAVRPRVTAQGHVADLQGPQSHPQVGVVGPQGQAVAFDQADVATARAMGGRGRIERLHGGAQRIAAAADAIAGADLQVAATAADLGRCAVAAQIDHRPIGRRQAHQAAAIGGAVGRLARQAGAIRRYHQIADQADRGPVAIGA